MPTTQTHHRESGKWISSLNKCIEVCIDGEKQYGIAAADVRDPDLKRLLQFFSNQRGDFVIAVQSLLSKFGTMPINQGTAEGTVRRGWMEIRKTVEGRSDRVVLEECIRGDRSAVRVYDHALQAVPPDSPEVRVMLDEQQRAILGTIQQLRDRLTVH